MHDLSLDPLSLEVRQNRANLCLHKSGNDVEELLVKVGEASVEFLLALGVLLLTRDHLDASDKLALLVKEGMHHVGLSSCRNTSVLVLLELGLGHVFARKVDHIEGAPFQHGSLQLQLVLHKLL